MDSVTMPNYSYVFRFEEEFDTPTQREWMKENWKSCFYYIGAYMIVIFGGQQYMATRSRFVLRKPLIMWNVFLAVFSIWGSYRTLPELLYVLTNFGFHYSVCVPGPSFIDNRIGSFWVWAFTLSKVPELFDTVFIVLRKQPLIFLHWYHHCTVLAYAWFSYQEYIPTARWFICMNYTVHAFMYSYYAFKAAGFRLPRYISMAITTSQLLQMVIGTIVNMWAYQVKAANQDCHVSYANVQASIIMYTSYFVLFARFFWKMYISQSKTDRSRCSQSSKSPSLHSCLSDNNNISQVPPLKVTKVE